MNKYLRGIIHVPCGVLKTCINKLIHGTQFQGSLVCAMSPLTEITVDRGGKLCFGKRFRMRDGAKIRVRKNGICTIGENVSMNSGNIITCMNRITIGNNVLLSPNVLIYDHDHDFRFEAADSKSYCSTPIAIGDNCWIGANTVILRGTELGANCVVGAGSVIKGKYPANSTIIQKRRTDVSVF